MNYKRIIKSRSVRSKILSFFRFVPDGLMIRVQYYLKTNHVLHLKNPRRFTEKLQWYKLYYRNPLMVNCVDKYDVREYVKKKGLKDILIPCYGVFACADEIQWDILPDQFVMKDTLGGGGNSVIIVEDKRSVNLDELKTIANGWITKRIVKNTGGREWPYYSGNGHRVIFEKYLQSDKENGGLIEYKFFCFNGCPRWLYVLADREFGISVGLGVYDMNFNKMNVTRNDEKPLLRELRKPAAFEEMKLIASRLSCDFPEARIDLYEKSGKVYFGEITFFDGSGYMTFSPDSADYQFGDYFELRKYK